MPKPLVFAFSVLLIAIWAGLAVAERVPDANPKIVPPGRMGSRGACRAAAKPTVPAANEAAGPRVSRATTIR